MLVNGTNYHTIWIHPANRHIPDCLESVFLSSQINRGKFEWQFSLVNDLNNMTICGMDPYRMVIGTVDSHS